MKILYLILACAISSTLYRCGGKGKPYNTKYRDVGCPLVLIGLAMLLFGVSKNWWCYLITFGLSWAALTTYMDSFFGYDNFYAHGFLCSAATIPLFWANIPLTILIIHAIICTIGMGVLSALIGNDVFEEQVRGVLYIL